MNATANTKGTPGVTSHLLLDKPTHARLNRYLAQQRTRRCRIVHTGGPGG